MTNSAFRNNDHLLRRIAALFLIGIAVVDMFITAWSAFLVTLWQLAESAASYAASQMTIVIPDKGNGFNPNRVPDPLSPEGLWCPSGRGLLLTRKFAGRTPNSSR